MTGPVVVGVDGSPESLAAAEWAGAEAELRGVPLSLVHGQGHVPHSPRYTGRHPASPEESLRAARERVGASSPSVEVTEEAASGAPPAVLLETAREADMVVVGSRGLGALTGFVLGSVGLSVISHATGPVVVVHGDGAGNGAKDEEAPPAEASPGNPARPEAASRSTAPVVTGVDLTHHYEDVLDFAFEAAARRGVPLRVAHAWSVRALYDYPSALPDPRVVAERDAWAGRALADALDPWREKYPSVEVEERTAAESAAPYLLETGEDAGLFVVGRQTRGHAHCTQVGPVTHAVLHHAHSPVAVIPHQ